MAMGNFSNQLGMGFVFTMHDNFTTVANRLDHRMHRITLNHHRFAAAVNLASTRMVAGMAILSASVVGAAVAMKSLNAASEYEKTEVAFTTMLGSAKAAQKTLAELKVMAVQTPFELKELEELTKKLLAFGLAQKDLIPTMKMLGDVSAGIGKDKMTRVIDNYGQIFGINKMNTKDRTEFMHKGIPVLQEVAKARGKGETVSELERKLARKETIITFKEVEAAFRSMTSTGGRFANLMQAQMVTLDGKISVVKDSLYLMSIAIGKILMPDAKRLIDTIGRLVDRLRRFMETAEGSSLIMFIVRFSVLATILASVFVVMGSVSFAVARLGVVMRGTSTGSMLLALSQGRLAAASWHLARATWGAVAPLIAMAATALGFVGAILLVGALIEWVTGGALHRMWKIFTSLVQVWRSFSFLTRTYELPRSLVVQLKSLGIYDLVLGLATWIVRLKYFFAGVGDGIKSVYNWFMGFFHFVVRFGQTWGIFTSRNTSEVERWANAGRNFGIIFGAVLLALAAHYIYLGLAAIWAGAVMLWGWIRQIPFIIYLTGMIIAATVHFVYMGIAAALAAVGINAAFAPVLGIMLLIIGAVLLLYKLFSGRSWSDIFSWNGGSIIPTFPGYEKTKYKNYSANPDYEGAVVRPVGGNDAQMQEHYRNRSKSNMNKMFKSEDEVLSTRYYQKFGDYVQMSSQTDSLIIRNNMYLDGKIVNQNIQRRRDIQKGRE